SGGRGVDEHAVAERSVDGHAYERAPQEDRQAGQHAGDDPRYGADPPDRYAEQRCAVSILGRCPQRDAHTGVAEDRGQPQGHGEKRRMMTNSTKPPINALPRMTMGHTDQYGQCWSTWRRSAVIPGTAPRAAAAKLMIRLVR